MVRYFDLINGVYSIDNDLNATQKFIALNNVLDILNKDNFIDKNIKNSLDIFIHCLMVTEIVNIDKERKEDVNK